MYELVYMQSENWKLPYELPNIFVAGNGDPERLNERGLD